MFGEWLFDGGLISKPGYEAGRAEATAVLCRIFSKLQRIEKFHTHYQRNFYAVLQQGVKADYLTLSSIVMNSTLLFTMNLDGFRLLYPDYVQGLFRVLPTIQAGNQEIKTDPDELRRNAYTVLSNIAFSLNYLARIETNHVITSMVIPEFADSPLQSWIDTLYPLQESTTPTLSNLKPAIVQLLLGSLITENNPRNAKILLNLIANYCVHEAEYTPAIYQIFVKVIQEKLLIQDHWSTEVILTSFDTLGVFCANITLKNELANPFLRELVLVVCTFIDVQLKSENVVPLQIRITRAYDLLAKVGLIDNWIVNDIAAQRAIMSALVKGIAILDREHPFSAIETVSTEPVTVPQYLSPSTVVTLGRLVENVKHDVSVSFATSTASGSVGNNSPAMQRGKKTQSRLSLAPNKRFQKLRLSFQPAGMNMVSTGSKDGGIGLPTFALLSAEIQIKTAAESVMSLLCLRISNFPPKNSCQGVTKLTCTWNEIQSIVKTAKMQQSLLEANEIGSTSIDAKRFVRYFAYQKRIIFAFVEQPSWANVDKRQNLPSIIITTRDSTGKFAWHGQLEYTDGSKRKNSKEESSKSFVGVGSELNLSAANSGHLPAVATPDEANVIKMESYMDCNIPSINELCILETMASLSEEIDKLRAQSVAELNEINITPTERLNIEAKPFPRTDSLNPTFIPKSFRILLATMGFLDYKMNAEITPLVSSDSLDSELEKLDNIRERDCFSVLVLICRSEDERAERMFTSSDGCSDYERFLWSLGWPVNPKNHLGFKGTLGEEYTLAPYFANLNMEIVFKCPYLSTREQFSVSGRTSTNIPARRRTSSAGGVDSATSLDELTALPTSKKSRQRSHSVGNALSDVPEVEKQEAENVAVIWLEDLHNLGTLSAQLPSHILIYIVVHPQLDCSGLYNIRLMSRSSIPEELLVCSINQHVGPLVDNMTIGEEGLAPLLRQTVSNIIKSHKIAKNTYRKPNLLRRQIIEEICNRHAGSRNGLFADILSQ
jgi:hypothetical protein